MKTLTLVSLYLWLSAGNLIAQTDLGLWLVSDYIYRGASLSSGKPAVQADLSHSGKYYFTGLWLSNVATTAANGSEMAAYAGFTKSFSDQISLSTGWFAYHYPDHIFGDTNEGYLALTLWRTRLKTWRNPSLHLAYHEVEYRRPLTEKLKLFAHAGRLVFAEDWGTNVTDWLLGLEYDLDLLKLQLAYSDRNTNERPSQSQLSLSLSKSFTL